MGFPNIISGGTCLHFMCVWTATRSSFLCVKQDCDTGATGPCSWMSRRSTQLEWWRISPFWFSHGGQVCKCVCVLRQGRHRGQGWLRDQTAKMTRSKSLLVPNCGNYSVGMERWRRTKPRKRKKNTNIFSKPLSEPILTDSGQVSRLPCAKGEECRYWANLEKSN